MSKKVISIFVIVLLVVTMLLSGCAPKAEGDKGTTAAGTTAPATEKVEAPTEITILTQDTYDPVWPLSRKLPIIEELQKRTNMKFNFQAIPFAQVSATVQTRLAAGTDLPDLIEITASPEIPPSTVYNLGKQGILLDMGALMGKAPNMVRTYEEIPSLKDRALSPDGKQYIYVGVASSEAQDFSGIWLRKDYFAKAGITKVPETTDELFDAIKAMQDNDVNGNGLKDELFLPFQFWQIEWALTAPFGVVDGEWNADKNGKVYFGKLSEGYKKMLQFTNRLYKAGLIDKEIANMPWDKYYAKMTSNQIMSSVNVPANILWNTENSNGGNSEIVYTPPLNRATGGVSVKNNMPFGSLFAITRDAEKAGKVDAIMKMLDYIYSPEGEMLFKYGIEGVHYNLVDGKVVRTQEWIDGLAKDPAHYLNSTGQGFGASLTGKSIMSAQEYIDMNIDKFKTDKVDPQAMLDIIKMYNVDTVGHYPYIPLLEDEDKKVQEIGTDWKNYIDEMRVKFFVGQESFDNWDNFVKTANERGGTAELAVRQGAYDRYMSLKK
ncbi:MAG: extracellular solute-binding protein [Ruminiclostridium sp.]|nr:extracellular solute-binding protein [Ruminiclostridium sp.]